MDRGVGAAVRPLSEIDRKDLAIQALAGSETVSNLAARHGMSRKFVYQQTHKARAALDDALSRVAQLELTLGAGARSNSARGLGGAASASSQAPASSFRFRQTSGHDTLKAKHATGERRHG